MALPELMARLERDAAARIAVMQAKARAEADALVAAARDEASRRRVDALEKKRRTLRAQLELEAASARQQARAQVLEARRRLLDRVAARAAALLVEAPPGPGLELLAKAGLRFVEALPTRLSCSPAAAAQLVATVKVVPTLELVIDPNAAPGLVLEAKDGTVRIDARLETLLARAWPRLSVEVLQEVER